MKLTEVRPGMRVFSILEGEGIVKTIHFGAVEVEWSGDRVTTMTQDKDGNLSLRAHKEPLEQAVADAGRAAIGERLARARLDRRIFPESNTLGIHVSDFIELRVTRARDDLVIDESFTLTEVLAEQLGQSFLHAVKKNTKLVWMRMSNHSEAIVGDFAGGDGVRFTLEHRPTCYRRGPWRLLVEVAQGPNHEKWGCFDEQDQPMRNYHAREAAESEAQAIADVLVRDRGQR